jgi:hypothetical protein
MMSELLEPGTHRLDVDGETFEVEAMSGGQCGFTWLSGRNLGYGFSSRRSDGGAWTTEEAESAIRDFLGMINPETGRLD